MYPYWYGPYGYPTWGAPAPRPYAPLPYVFDQWAPSTSSSLQPQQCWTHRPPGPTNPVGGQVRPPPKFVVQQQQPARTTTGDVIKIGTTDVMINNKMQGPMIFLANSNSNSVVEKTPPVKSAAASNQEASSSKTALEPRYS